MSLPLGMSVSLPWDWVGQYIDGGPFTSFSRSFYVDRAVNYSVLEFDVLTQYEDYAAAAVVLINNQQAGTIDPRPLSRYQDLQPYSIIFGNGLLTGPSPHTGLNNLRINPVSQLDWLVVAKWRILYQRSF